MIDEIYTFDAPGVNPASGARDAALSTTHSTPANLHAEKMALASEHDFSDLKNHVDRIFDNVRKLETKLKQAE